MTSVDVFTAITELCPNANFSCDNTYESVVWTSSNIQKPTKAEVEAKQLELTNKLPITILRAERNNKLFETDMYAIPDFGHASEEVKQSWLTYRQELRDLPSTATPQLDENGNLTNVTWPTPPS